MTIIAGVDASERSRAVITQAKDLADAYGVSLHIVHVADIAAASGRDEVGGPKLELEKARESAAAVAAAAGDALLDPGEYEAVGLVGDTAHELLAYSEAHAGKYIVVCGRKRSPLGQMVFGSVTQSLLLHTTTPVVCVGETTEESGRT